MSDKLKAEIAALVPRLRRFASALSGSRDEGDDIVQSACLRAVQRLEQFTPGTHLDRWMFRIVRNVFLDRTRARKRRNEVPEENSADLCDHGLGASRAETRLTLERVREAIALLPEDQRAVITLVAIDGRTYRETADILEVPIGTVMSRLARARARLMPLIEEPKG